MVGSKIDADEARRAKLHSKTHLRDLEIVAPPTMDEDDVFKVLNPPSYVRLASLESIGDDHIKDIFNIPTISTCLFINKAAFQFLSAATGGGDNM